MCTAMECSLEAAGSHENVFAKNFVNMSTKEVRNVMPEPIANTASSVFKGTLLVSKVNF